MRPDARELCSVWPVCALGFALGFAWPGRCSSTSAWACRPVCVYFGQASGSANAGTWAAAGRGWSPVRDSDSVSGWERCADRRIRSGAWAEPKRNEMPGTSRNATDLKSVDIAIGVLPVLESWPGRRLVLAGDALLCYRSRYR